MSTEPNSAKLCDMDIHFTKQQEAIIRDGIEAGRFRSPDDAVAEALSLWEQREARIAQAVQRGIEEADRGEFVSHEEVLAIVEKARLP